MRKIPVTKRPKEVPFPLPYTRDQINQIQARFPLLISYEAMRLLQNEILLNRLENLIQLQESKTILFDGGPIGIDENLFKPENLDNDA